jgi:hypothetical protein
MRLTRIMSQDEFFGKVLKIKTVLFECALIVFTIFSCLLCEEKVKGSCCLLLWKNNIIIGKSFPSGDFTHENAYWELACSLKFHSALDMYTSTMSLIFLASSKGWTLEKIDQWQRGKPVQKLWCGFRKFLELLNVFKEAARNFIYLSLEQGSLNLKSHACTESTDLIL